jgi:hypothetical protein
LLTKLHLNYIKEQEGKAPGAQAESTEVLPNRKPNFFDRKRFVDYEQNQDSDNVDNEKSKEQLNTNSKPAGKMVVQMEE